MASIIGTNPNQVPTNSDLGTMAYLDADREYRRLIGGRKNILTNGDFQVSQRGTYTSATTTSSGTYYLDRWVTNQSLSATIQHNQDVFLPNGMYVNTLKMACTQTGTGYIQIRQVLEEQVTDMLRNQQVTLSCWIKTNKTDIDGFGIAILNPNASWATSDLRRHQTDGEWHKVSTTIQLSTSSGSSQRIEVGIQNNNNWVTGEYYEIALMQLEVGSIASDFEQRTYGEELTLCSRYYHEIKQFVFNANKGNDTYWDGHARAGSYPFPVPMRTSPTVTIVQTFGWLANTSGWTTPSSGRHPVSIGVTNEQNVAFTGSNYWDDSGTGGNAQNTTAVRIEKATVDAEI